MKRAVSCAVLVLFLAVFPTFAVTVSSPGNGAQVSSPFSLAASASSCSSQAVTAMGYSLDASTATTVVSGTTMEKQVSASTGTHTLHVKAWGNQGAVCVADVAINVAAGASSAGIQVSSPGNGATVTLPFTVAAYAPTCSSQAVSAMGYSLDNSTGTTTVSGTTINSSVSSASTGAHTLHVKSWGNQGASCVADVAVNVTASSSSAAAVSQTVSVSSPTSGASVSSPFQLSASSSSCSSQAVSTMGYSLDSSSSTAVVSGTTLSTQVSAGTGAHTLHVKSWGKSGASCVRDVAVNVTGGTGGPSIPSSAKSVSNIQTLSNWAAEYDSGTGSGSASGWMTLVGSPSQSGHAREFVSSFKDYGGERYHVSFGDDTSAQNFVYDAWVYLTSSSSQIANLEMDLNQTMPNGQTAIFGFQCDGWTSTWDFTANKGSPGSPDDTWVKSSQYCNPRTWSINTWHHVQISYSRDGSGNVTYKSVWLDGREMPINQTVNSAFALGWAPVLLTNFQVDELSSGSASATVYLDNVTVYRW